MKNIAFALTSSYRFIAAVTAIALLAWAIGIPSWVGTAQAANVERFSDTISDSDRSVEAQHDIFFRVPNGMVAGEDFRINFSTTTGVFDFSNVVDADLTASSTGFTAVTNGNCSGAADEIELARVSNSITGNVCPASTIASSTQIGIQVGNGTGNEVINPAWSGSYVISLEGTGATPIQDSGATRIAIIDDVTVTASVDTRFTFTINPVDQGVTVNDSVIPTTGTTTATTVPFGTIAPGFANRKLMAQELRVDTNAFNGFAVTVQANQTLEAGNGATIDEFIDGLETGSTTLWTSPAGTMGLPDTYGHWGLTTDDDGVSSTTANIWGDGEAAYIGSFVANPVEVFYHDTPVESATAGMGYGSTTVGYMVEIMALQEAANDYTATLTYIATPVF